MVFKIREILVFGCTCNVRYQLSSYLSLLLQVWRFILTQLPVRFRSLTDTMTSGYILETDTISIFTVYACVENIRMSCSVCFIIIVIMLSEFGIVMDSLLGLQTFHVHCVNHILERPINDCLIVSLL